MEAAPFHALPPGGLAPSRTVWLHASDGVRLRAAEWAAEVPRARAVLFTGRTEFLEKAAVPAAALVARGISVISVDWRGQGLSDRLVEPALKGHVADFADFQRDVDALMAGPWERPPGPQILIGHSMGGAIALGALTRRPSLAVDAAILSAPMLGLAIPRLARPLAWATARVGRLVGAGSRWPPFGDVATAYALSDVAPEENVLTHDLALWRWMGEALRAEPGLQLAMPTLGWFDAAFAEMGRLAKVSRPACPLMFLLGTEETVVSPDAIRGAASRYQATLSVIDQARHEVFIEAPEARAEAWAAVDAFLDPVLGSQTKGH